MSASVAITPRPARRFPALMIGAALMAALPVAVVLATSVGAVEIPPVVVAETLWRWLTGQLDEPTGYEAIVAHIRLPRVLVAGLVGAGLALAGAAYQGLFRNPLADPYLIGVAAGAGLGATLAIASGLALPLLGPLGSVPLAATVGGVATVIAVYAIARRGGGAPTIALILAGVVVSALLGAITGALLFLGDERVRQVLGWLLGSLTLASWPRFLYALPFVLGGGLVLAALARSLNALQLGEDQASSLGVNVSRNRLLVVAGATLATAGAVSVAGLIGFVGLVVPHAVRLLAGPDHRALLPLSALGGALFLIGVDLVARSAFGGGEFPVGLLTALIGGPIFLVLLRHRVRALE